MTDKQQQLLQQALALHQDQKLDAAELLYRQILDADPNHAPALQLLGVLHERRGNVQEAIVLMKRSLALDPQQPHVHLNLGNASGTAGDYDAALDHYHQAIALNPAYAEAYYNRGNMLSGLKRFDAALASYDRAIALKTDFADAYLNRGNVFKDLRRFDQALEDYRRVAALAPGRADALNNQGNAFEEMGDTEQAIVCYRQAVASDASYAPAFNNLAGLLRNTRRYDEALEVYRKALALDPNLDFLQGAALHAQQHVCDWSDLEANVGGVLAGVDQGRKVSSPFMLLATSATPAQQLRAAEIYAAARYPAAFASAWQGLRYQHRKVRIGYFSADFHNHATAHLIAGLIQNHDRARFEITGFAWGAHADSAIRSRLENAFDHLIDVHRMSDRKIAELAAWHEIDIAVDLKGFTHNARPGIFANRCAPVQASYLGFPATMGADYIDYLIADAHIIPAAQRAFYRERVVLLPDTYQANDDKRGTGGAPPARTALGLPDKGFVFCSFNNTYKITPEVFDIWMRVLQAVPGSVLWLLEGSATACVNLRREAERRGVKAERLVFAPRVEMDAHLARHAHADLFLDTFHCNGHTTTSDALWMGVPVLTWPSATFAGRVSASLLSAIGLDELIAANPQAYEALAVALARDAAGLAGVKAKLQANRGAKPLFDTVGFTRHLETAYLGMWGRTQRGLPPVDITVSR